ncbi:hypothetical protein AAVH_15331 [Aphelenchoides avenae]|nr:hypothetical protein AAVH_15331 [Aphelenchus avenae]
MSIPTVSRMLNVKGFAGVGRVIPAAAASAALATCCCCCCCMRSAATAFTGTKEKDVDEGEGEDCLDPLVAREDVEEKGGCH